MAQDFELISIIMAAYNAEKTIEQAIESVLNQTYDNDKGGKANELRYYAGRQSSPTGHHF